MGTLIEGPQAIAQRSALAFATVARMWANPNIGGY
jgi:hypothetical protein